MVNNIYRTFHSTSNNWQLLRCFHNTTEINLNFNLRKFDNLNNLFANFTQLTTLNLANNCDLTGIQSLDHMFYFCSNLQNLDFSQWQTQTVKDFSRMFAYCRGLQQLNISNWNISNATNLSNMFSQCYRLTNLDVFNWNTSKVTNLSYAFYYCSNLTDLNVSNWNTSNVDNLAYIFEWCYQLKTLDVSNWNTSKITNLSDAFKYCYNLTDLNISNWNTSNIINMAGAFANCRVVNTLNVSNWNTDKVKDLSSIFKDCRVVNTLDVSNWKVDNVNNLSYAFGICQNVQNLDISNWNVSNVTNLAGTFAYCENLTNLDLSKWNISNVTSMVETFKKCSNLTSLNISNWNLNKVNNWSNTFNNTGKRWNLKKNIYGLDFNWVQNWNFSNVTNMNGFLNNAKCGYFPLYNINNIQPYINTGLPNIYWNTDNVIDISWAFAFEWAWPRGNQEQPGVYKKNGYWFPSNSISSNWFFNFSNVKNAVGTFSANSYYFWYEYDGEGASLSGADYWLYLNNTEKIINAKNMFAISFSSGGYPPDQWDEYSDAPTFNIQNTILNFSNVSDASYLFYNYQPVSNSNQWYWDTSVEVMAKKPLPTLILNNIINLYQAYYNTRTTTIDTTYWNLSKVTNIAQAFTLSFALDNASLKNIANALLTATNLSASQKNLFTNNTISPFYLPDPSTTGYDINMMINNATVGTSLVSQLRSAGWSVPE